jgi:hypothetical protein
MDSILLKLSTLMFSNHLENLNTHIPKVLSTLVVSFLMTLEDISSMLELIDMTLLEHRGSGVTQSIIQKLFSKRNLRYALLYIHRFEGNTQIRHKQSLRHIAQIRNILKMCSDEVINLGHMVSRANAKLSNIKRMCQIYCNMVEKISLENKTLSYVNKSICYKRYKSIKGMYSNSKYTITSSCLEDYMMHLYLHCSAHLFINKHLKN